MHVKTSWKYEIEAEAAHLSVGKPRQQFCWWGTLGSSSVREEAQVAVLLWSVRGEA